MLTSTPVGCSWSGGKDSCYALMKAVENGAIPKVLLNVMNEDGKISRSHGLPASILQQQAAALGVPLLSVASSWAAYEKTFTDTLNILKSEYEIECMVFGDIDLDAHREWEEKVCRAAGLVAALPLWKRERKTLLLEMLANGIQTMIVSCNLQLGEAFLGRMLDHELIPELEAKGVDVCGEGGEFHTVVIDCPLFQQPVNLPPSYKIRHEEYYFLQYVSG
jgi:diphthine-ammonia ligase